MCDDDCFCLVIFVLCFFVFSIGMIGGIWDRIS